MRRVLYSRGDLFERGRSFFNRGCLLFGPTGEIVSGLADFTGTGIDGAGVLSNIGQSVVEFADRTVEVFAQTIQAGDEGRSDPSAIQPNQR